MSLHDLDDLSHNNSAPLLLDYLFLMNFLLCQFRRLFLLCFPRHEVDSDGASLEVHVEGNLFFVCEDGLLDLFAEELHLRVAQLQHGVDEIRLWYLSQGF